MMLRSSSTPVLGSLLSSDNPNIHNNHHETKQTPSTIHHTYNKFPFYQSGSLNFSTVSCNSPPISPSIEHKSFMRRAQSDGNLDGLAYASGSNNGDQLFDSYQPIKLTGKPKCSLLQTIPSLSFYTRNGDLQDEEEEEEEEEDSDIEDNEASHEFEEHFESGIGGGNSVVAMAGANYGMKSGKMNKLKFDEEVRNTVEIWNAIQERDMVGQEMYLAKGLGIGSGSGSGSGGGGGGGSGREFSSAGSAGDGGDNHDIEEYYKKMVEENPGNPLFLRNYAQLLYQSNGDLQKAEEYYSRAILADPKDGEVLSQYAKLIWELHHDRHRALSYFERAVQASPEDSHVHASYASFLWDTEEDEDDSNVEKDRKVVHSHLGTETMASASA